MIIVFKELGVLNSSGEERRRRKRRLQNKDIILGHNTVDQNVKVEKCENGKPENMK